MSTSEAYAHNGYVDNKIIPRLTINGEGVREETIRHHTRRYELAASHVTDASITVDLCCGTGYGTGMMKEAGAKHAVGVDLSHEAIDFAQSNYGHSGGVYVRDSVIDFLDAMPADPDVITFYEAIEHVPREDGLKILDAAQRSLADDGSFFLSTPRDIRSDVNPDHITQWTFDELSEALGERFHDVDLFGQDWATGDFVRDSPETSAFFIAKCSSPIK
jgi:2-polyprenyl-3-methyl-5-hydroxy-6-metoxy-1,4-benzoquinol methylase